ncbi:MULTISPECIES: DNA-3-methyladenine glycosylase 2 family protein [unclassified Leucobacter]|uniref:DNA-3-methyladenine glycosylase 2 family protein n=1 Tax=unclassified Leucobacter TaxID=2621730 RepID=UPI00165DC78B|nr:MULTISPECIES: AlkA N-terminal domain-containing protein [unclassified Leucobacter]MBC9935266.1 DNA-3-methyladenine glycosylase 2 family protein [Leucobacter sp. cx-87]
MNTPTGPLAAPRTTGPRCAPGDPLFEERYRAIDARDTRFDGQFFTAVRSTGIYCRPSCPARTPKPAHVSFYLTSAAAHEAGFRACKRCLPDAAPGTPEWDLRGDLVGRAMRLISDGVVDREGVDGLSRRLGYTPRQVGRILASELGAPPLALARARRAQSARALLVGSDLPMAQVAFAAGFGSVRQFNDTVRAVFDSQPGELRARFGAARSDTRPEPADATESTGHGVRARLELALPVRWPFDAPGVFAFLAARAVAGVESADSGDPARLRYARTLALPHGPAACEVIATQSRAGEWSLRVRLELSDVADVAPAVARVRRLLDLDADPMAIDAALSADPVLAPLVARTPGIRVPGAVDPHELVVRALVGQQISVVAARGHLSRLAAALGSPYTSAFSGLSRIFPDPAQIAAGLPDPPQTGPLDPERPLRLPRQSIRAVAATASALADGTLAVHVGADASALRDSLLERPRIGPWTAAYVAMRVLGDPDAWLDGDVALVAGARAIGAIGAEQSASASHRALAERALVWAPWRSYASMHLWRSAGSAAPLPLVSRKAPQ